MAVGDVSFVVPLPDTLSQGHTLFIPEVNLKTDCCQIH